MRDTSPWIEFHAGAREHGKILDLSTYLHVPYAHAAGLMACLWASPYAIAHEGNLQGCSDAYVASLAKWHGEANGFVSYLKQARLVDEDMRIHDYQLHGTRILRDARERVAKCRRDQARKQRKRSVT